MTKLAALADLIEDRADISDVPGPLRRRAAKALREVPDVSVADLLAERDAAIVECARERQLVELFSAYLLTPCLPSTRA